MKVRFRVQGGIGFFPGLAGPAEIAVDTLPPEQRAGLEAALAEADFFDRANPPPVAPAARDARTYEITVDDGARSRTMRVSDPVPSDLRRLLQVLRDLTHR
jgi:hypothetical protein